MKHTNQLPKQHKQTDRLLVNDYELLTASELAERIARICFGVYDWQGVKDCLFPSGMSRLANKYLRDNQIASSNARIGEEQYSYGMSRYYPYWK